MKSIGYIVVCYGVGPMLQGDDGQLYFGESVTLFNNRRQANKAIDKTKENRLAEFERDFEVEFGPLQIKRVNPTV